MGLYELAVLFDPRLSDEETGELSDGVKELLTSLDAEIVKEESWGKKKLAYAIQKLTEARYAFYTIKTDGNPFPEVEQRLEQNDKVLRYMTVRLDEGRLRRRGKEEPEAVAAAATPAPEAAATPAAPAAEKEAS